MAHRKQFDLEKASILYKDDGLSTSQIAKIFKVHLQTIINRFKEAKIPLRPQGQAPSTIDSDRIKYDYETNKMSTKNIAKTYNISVSLVQKKLKEAGVKLLRVGGISRTIPIDRIKLLTLYLEQQLSLTACAEQFRVSSSVIRRRLKQNGIKIRSVGEQQTDKSVDDVKIIDLYWNQKLSIAETAKKLGKSHGFVKKHLKKSGRGTRTVSGGARLWRGSDEIPDEQLIHLYDGCGWSCEKISAYFNKSSQFVLKRFIAIGKERRKNIGENNGSWKGGVTDIRNAVRSCAASSQWRTDAFSRQQYKSEISDQQIRELNCHHIYPFHVILRSSITKHSPLLDEYRNLAIINDPRFYDANNSLVISKEEHDKIEEGKLEQAHPWWKIWQAYPDFAIKRSDLTHNDFQLFDDNGQLQPIEYYIQASATKEIRQIIRYEHYLGTLPGSKLILVAKRGNIIIGIATFGIGTNKYIEKNTWELTRLCIPFYVVRPFSCDFLNQCCQYIRDNYTQIKKLISFADSSVGHNGGVYRMAKWDKAGKTQPSYAYFDPLALKLMHKSSCRRIKNIDKTERELAQERGWIRIPLGHKYRYTLIL
jgi:transposase